MASDRCLLSVPLGHSPPPPSSLGRGHREDHPRQRKAAAPRPFSLPTLREARMASARMASVASNGMKPPPRKTAPDVRRRALKLLAAHPNGCTEAILAAENISVISTTLADLLTPLLVANPFSAMRTSLRWWSSDEFEDGVAHGWQSRLRRWPVDSFFPALLLRGGDAGGRRMRSSS